MSNNRQRRPFEGEPMYENLVDDLPECLWTPVYYARPQTWVELRDFIKHELLSSRLAEEHGFEPYDFDERREMREVLQELSQKLSAQEKSNGAKLCVDSWAGRREYPVDVLAETETQLQIRMLSDGLLPRGHVKAGEILKVPREAVRGLERSQKSEEQKQGMEL